MKQQWALQDAKSHFSEVVKCAKNKGPQFISVHGKTIRCHFVTET